VIKKQGKNQIN